MGVVTDDEMRVLMYSIHSLSAPGDDGIAAGVWKSLAAGSEQCRLPSTCLSPRVLLLG